MQINILSIYREREREMREKSYLNIKLNGFIIKIWGGQGCKGDGLKLKTCKDKHCKV